MYLGLGIERHMRSVCCERKRRRRAAVSLDECGVKGHEKVLGKQWRHNAFDVLTFVEVLSCDL